MLRKKRVTISEQAQAAIAAGMPVDQALAEHGIPDPSAGDAPDPQEDVTPAPAAIDPPAESEAVAEEQDTQEEEDETPAVSIAASSNDAVSSLLDRLQTAQNTIATQTSQLKQMTESVDALQAVQKSLMEIAAAAINRMQIGLGGTATDMSSFTAENLLAQYKSTLTTFETRLPVGGKAEVPVSDEDRDGTVVPLVSPAFARATKIRS